MGETNAGTPPAGTWKIDASHTRVGFVARHLMVTKVRGQFTAVEGDITIGATPDESNVVVKIDPSSIMTGDQRRDDHLRSGDFLEVEKYPEITFRSTKVDVKGDAALTVTGDLTIRDVTKPVVLDVEYEGIIRDPMGNTKAGFTATTEIDREEFGVTWNMALETGGFVLGKIVKVELDIQAALAQAADQSSAA